MATNNSTLAAVAVCGPILSTSDSRDGGLPLVLGINIGFAAVSIYYTCVCVSLLSLSFFF